ncbi:MAG TPA: hypothetical protein VGO93_23490 [Candidatus Xenobia bacterium]|jgi:predicted DNA binding CopG/RHH family protein
MVTAAPVRTEQIHVRLTQRQATIVRTLAARQGLAPATYVRQLIALRIQAAEEAARPVYR